MALSPTSSHSGAPTGTASGDLSGTYPAPTVAKVNGIAVSGTPSLGQVPTATGATAATWQTPGVAFVVRGPFAFAYNTPSLTGGVTVYTPTVGDWLLDAWISVVTAFDGTTPTADIGQFGGNFGLWSAGATGQGPDLSQADAASNFTSGLLMNGNSTNGPQTLAGNNAYLPGPAPQYVRNVPARFQTADPLKLVVSQNGLKGGAAIGGAAGAANLYIVTATPAAF